MLWIPFTLLAAFMQSWRNAFQNKLSAHVSTMGVTLSRFIFAAPIAALYLFLLYQYQPQNQLIPDLSASLIFAVLIASMAQIAATAFMVILFQKRNYAIGVGLAKSEAVIAAALGAMFFLAPLTPLAWFGVIIGSIAVWLMSVKKQAAATKDSFSWSVILIGLASGLCFALTTLWIREACLELNAVGLSFAYSAAWVLLWVISLQTIMLTLWLLFKEPQTLKALWDHRKMVVAISFFSCIGSIGWFTAMSLETVALVKTLGQVEILFTLIISARWFKNKLSKRETVGLVLVGISAICVILK